MAVVKREAESSVRKSERNRRSESRSSSPLNSRSRGDRIGDYIILISGEK